MKIPLLASCSTARARAGRVPSSSRTTPVIVPPPLSVQPPSLGGSAPNNRLGQPRNCGSVALSANEAVLFAAACAASSTPYELHTEHRALLSARQLLWLPLRPLGVPLSRLPRLPRVPRPHSASLAAASDNAFSRSIRAASRSAARALRASMTRTRASSRALLPGSFGPGAARNFSSSAALAFADAACRPRKSEL